MDHPHHYLLDEYHFSIEKLVPLTPEPIRQEAERLYVELLANEHVSERQIHQALVEIGKKEYPYRKAYQELCAGDEEKRFEIAAFAHMDTDLAEKIRATTMHGVHLTDYVKSKLFESQLGADERYRVEQAILTAHDAVGRQCDERATTRQQNFETLVAQWSLKRDAIQRFIDELRAMAERSPHLAGDILAQADAFEEGWSIVSRDPQEQEVREALTSFATQLEEQTDDDALIL